MLQSKTYACQRINIIIAFVSIITAFRSTRFLWTHFNDRYFRESSEKRRLRATFFSPVRMPVRRKTLAVRKMT